MTRRSSAIITFVAIISLGLAAYAQNPSPQVSPSDPPRLETGRYGNPTSTARAYQHFKLGIVSEVNKDELQIDNTPYGERQWFKVTPKTKFIHDGATADVSQLKVGENVFIDVKTDKKTGNFYLVTIAWGVVGKKMKGQGANP